jgi:hypothetical protein
VGRGLLKNGGERDVDFGVERAFVLEVENFYVW